MSIEELKNGELINVRNILTSIILIIFQYQLTNITSKIEELNKSTYINGISITRTTTLVANLIKQFDDTSDDITNITNINSTNNVRLSNLELRVGNIEKEEK